MIMIINLIKKKLSKQMMMMIMNIKIIKMKNNKKILLKK